MERGTGGRSQGCTLQTAIIITYRLQHAISPGVVTTIGRFHYVVLLHSTFPQYYLPVVYIPGQEFPPVSLRTMVYVISRSLVPTHDQRTKLNFPESK